MSVKNWIVSRASEKSTWAGIVVLAGLTGRITVEDAAAVCDTIIALAGLYAAITQEKQ